MLLFNSFSWYFPLFVLFTDSIALLKPDYLQLVAIFGFHYLAVAGSAFLGNRFVERIGRNRLLSLWIVLGIFSSALMILVNSSNFLVVYATSVLLGVSLGLGFPSCLSYFGENSPSDRKGFIGGVAFAFTFVAIAVAGFLTAPPASFTFSVAGFTLWRFLGLVFFLGLKTEEKNVQNIQMKVPYLNIIRERSFLLYLVPWIIFCVVNFFQAPLFDTQLETGYMISLGEFGIGGISMLVGGYFSDRIGRKRLIIAAYAMVGVGYALLSFASGNLAAFYAYVLLDGIAWGIFFLMFLLVVWGDLAQSRNKNQYYLIGNLPFILSSYISVIVSPISQNVPLSAAFSFASFFLFLAVIPLTVAPETLPEKVMREQDLRSYAEKALKQAMKETDNKESLEGEPEIAVEPEEAREDEEARRLAEQYY